MSEYTNEIQKIVEFKNPNKQTVKKKLIVRKKESRKCALPICENITTHNGGYCCAEHCKIHKKDRN